MRDHSTEYQCGCLVQAARHLVDLFVAGYEFEPAFGQAATEFRRHWGNVTQRSTQQPENVGQLISTAMAVIFAAEGYVPTRSS